MARFAVTQPVLPGSNRHRAFDEVAELLMFGLRRLGHEAIITPAGNLDGYQHIVVGADLIRYIPGYDLARNAIVYNLEQLGGDSHYLDAKRDLYRDHPVWTYCKANADALEAAGLCRPPVVPIGWTPELDRVPQGVERDIDVLFYGSPNTRRVKIVNDLREAGLTVEACWEGVYGAERDALIARAKVCLNVHFYTPPRFEIVRVGYLLGNGACVVSESGDGDDIANPDGDWCDAVVFESYANLVAACREWVNAPDDCAAWREVGRDIMRSRDEARIIEEALG